MKKALAIILALLMAFTLFACNSQSSGSSPASKRAGLKRAGLQRPGLQRPGLGRGARRRTVPG